MTKISYHEMKIYQFENTEMNLFGFEVFFPSFSLGKNYLNLQKLHEPAVLGMNNYHLKCFDPKKVMPLDKEEGQMS